MEKTNREQGTHRTWLSKDGSERRMTCEGPCSAKDKYERDNKTFNPDCPRCMEIWCQFLKEINAYVVTDKK